MTARERSAPFNAQSEALGSKMRLRALHFFYMCSQAIGPKNSNFNN